MNYSKLPCDEYIEILSSKEPVPGGGGTSALVGALGCALGNMVGSLTVGKKKYADIEDTLISLQREMKEVTSDLIICVDRDTEVFAKLAAAYKMPKSTPEEIAEKDRVMEECLKEASDVPIAIMEKCCKAVELVEKFAELGSPMAISDAGVAAVLCKAAIEGAALNVYINTKSMKNEALAGELNRKTAGLIDEYCGRAMQVYNSVSERLII
ncbi:MAG: cyclodeaminase/cyclohydrolase family protein [Lachnospiraceae bacterium]|jgi:formiminotetrahydrofolate cyclodeaminase